MRSNRDNLKSWLFNNQVDLTEDEYLTKVNNLIKSFGKQNLYILPYEKLIDIENAGQEFVNNLTEGLLFKIYIPNQKMWSNEFDKFITLFREYASSISGKELIIKQQRTDFGVMCSLFSINNDINEQEINNLYSEFSSFMDICAINPDEAREIISDLKIPKEQQDKIFQKYSKEAKRLQLDLKQERESRLLQIKHCLENELQEFSIEGKLSQYVNSLVPNSITSQNGLCIRNKIDTQIININPQIIGKVEGVVSRVINGNIEFAQEEKELFKLIELYTEKAIENETLKSAIYELNDTGIPQEQKRMAWQKLSSFLCKVANKVGDVGVCLLSKYLEQKIGI